MKRVLLGGPGFITTAYVYELEEGGYRAKIEIKSLNYENEDNGSFKDEKEAIIALMAELNKAGTVTNFSIKEEQ